MQAWEEKYYAKEDGREEGRKEHLMEQVAKKLKKGKEVIVIADELEEEVETILDIIREINESKEEN